MDVDLTIRYSDDRLCAVVVCRTQDETPLHRIVARRAHLGDRIGERMRSRLHEMCKKVEMEGRDYRLHSKKAHFQPIEAPARIKVRGKKAE